MTGNITICIRGAGDLASGVALRLHRSGFRRIVLLEREKPLAVRRLVAFSEAVYDGSATVEGLTCRLAADTGEIEKIWAEGKIPLLVDPEGKSIARLAPDVLVDATIAKVNTGMTMDLAPLTIGLGPGFTAGKDVHCVVETNRGHSMGRLKREGSAEPNTGIPGSVAGYALERLLRAPQDGIFTAELEIGSLVKAGQVVAHVGDAPVTAQIGGVLRGLLRSGVQAQKGLKLGDVDPRANRDFCREVSEKSLAIGGGVLEATVSHYFSKQ